MSVIIRLQNLPWTANALDIRRFFSGLSIPDGGVHIVGGEKGDAFIAFSTDEDARRAMLMDNGRLASNVLKLFLSSKTEMQNVIAVARGVPTSASSGPPPASQSQQGYSTSQGPPPVAGGPPPMNPRYGPQGGQQGYPNQGPPFGGPPMGPPPGGPGGNLNVAAPDPRPGMAPPYGSQPSQGMPPQMGQGRPGERPMWDGPPPSSQGNMPMEYGRRENIPPPVEMDRGRDLPPQGMGPQGGYDRNMPPRDVGPNQGYHDSGMGPMNGSQQMMDRPPQGPPPHEYRDDPRDFRDNYEYRDHSPGRDRNRYEPESSYDRRDGRKRGYGGGSPYVFASNMPQDINYKDVRKFFTGYEIPRDGLKLINDRKGRRVGDAYVRFSSPDMADEALKLDGWSMGDRTVRVEMATAEEFERAIDSYVPGTSPEREPRNDSRIAYESYDRGGNMNYGRGDVNYDRAGPVRHEPPMKRKRSLSPSEVRKGDSCCVVVKNLPFKIEKRDLFKFFTGLKFAKGDTSVHIEVGPDGRPKGIALIEFLSDKDVHRALSYHRKASLGGRLIEVISIPVDEYRTRAAKYIKAENKDAGAAKEHISSRKRDEIKIIETKGTKDSKDTSKADTKKIETKGTDQNKDKEAATKDAKKREETETKKPRNESKKEVSTDEKRYYCVELKGVPFSTKNDTIRDFFSGLQIAQRGIHIVFKPDGTAAGPAFVEFITSDDCKKALKRDKEYIGKRYIDVKPITKKEMLEELAQHQAKFSQSSHRQNGPPGPGSGSSVAQKVGRPGCVVSVQNMHFSSTLEDILDFFRGFHPIANSVKMRYNQDGLPTGDAMVAFHNREDADRATSELNRSKMRNRIVSVYLA